MKTDSENNEMNIDESAVSVHVDSEVIDRVRTGDITHIVLDVNSENYRYFLENIDGHLTLVVDEMPNTFHGCYLYNNGVFPYVVKDALEFLVLDDGEATCLAKIISINAEPGTRFHFRGYDEPIIEDSEGDSCVWELQFEVVPVPENPKKYLMRWNPSVSSFTEQDFKECLSKMVHGMFRMNWSIYEWEEARRGDMFYMMRVGDDMAGIVFSGQFISDPYPSDDWAGSTRRRMYVDMVCLNSVEPGEKAHVSLEELQNAIPEFEWSKGHSGVLLSGDVVEKLVELLDKEG